MNYYPLGWNGVGWITSSLFETGGERFEMGVGWFTTPLFRMWGRWITSPLFETGGDELLPPCSDRGWVNYYSLVWMGDGWGEVNHYPLCRGRGRVDRSGFYRCSLWLRTVCTWDINSHSILWAQEWVSGRVSDKGSKEVRASKLSGAKGAVRSNRMSEWCNEWTSKRKSKWPSTYVPIFWGIKPLWSGIRRKGVKEWWGCWRGELCQVIEAFSGDQAKTSRKIMFPFYGSSFFLEDLALLCEDLLKERGSFFASNSFWSFGLWLMEIDFGIVI